MIKDKKKYTFLVIEDNPGDYVIAEDYLSEKFIDPVIVHAVNFKQTAAILSAGDTTFDAILLDLTIPDKNGKDLISDMLHIASLCPIIVLTGYTDINFSMLSIGEGIADYLIKDDLTASILHKSIIYAINRKKASAILMQSEARLIQAQEVAKVGSWETDLTTKEVVWSKETYRIFDMDPDKYPLSHFDFLESVHPEDKAKVDTAFAGSIPKQSINTIEHRIITPTGLTKIVEERWQITNDDKGNPQKAVGTTQDITERIKSEESNRFKAELLNTIGQAVITTDLEGIITYWNKAAEELYGWKAEQTMGHNIIDITPSEQTKEQSIKIIQELYKGSSWSGELELHRKDSSRFTAQVTNAPVYDQYHKLVGIIGVSSDITERKKVEATLLQTQQLLSEAQNLAKIGHWNFDTAKGKVFWSDSFRSIYGVGPEYDPGSPKESLSLIYHEDRERVWKELMQVQRSGISLNNKYRIVRPDGEVRTLRAVTTAELNDTGKLLRMYGIIEDITELNFVEEELHNSFAELEFRVEERTKELSDKNKSITDSINYAKRIQVGLLTPYSQLTELFPRSFILSEPQNIVSGDFFWCYQKHNKKFIVVADCTGHGVPGALMSIIGNNLLNGIVVDEHIDNPSEILQLLDARLKEAVKGDKGEIKDGMDIALCVVDTYFKEVYFAGAYRPLFISDENGKIRELMGNSSSIGGGMGEVNKKFETRRFAIIPGQRIYLTSDGYYSQFGGPEGKKFMKKHFRETLEELQENAVEEQKDKLQQVFTEWAGINEQVDDVMVVGIEL